MSKKLSSCKNQEKEMASHSSILTWKTPWTEELGGLYIVHGVTKSQTQLSTHARIRKIFVPQLREKAINRIRSIYKRSDETAKILEQLL